jgi:hypothetical protein
MYSNNSEIARIVTLSVVEGHNSDSFRKFFDSGIEFSDSFFDFFTRKT